METKEAFSARPHPAESVAFDGICMPLPRSLKIKTCPSSGCQRHYQAGNAWFVPNEETSVIND